MPRQLGGCRSSLQHGGGAAACRGSWKPPPPVGRAPGPGGMCCIAPERAPVDVHICTRKQAAPGNWVHSHLCGADRSRARRAMTPAMRQVTKALPGGGKLELDVAAIRQRIEQLGSSYVPR